MKEAKEYLDGFVNDHYKENYSQSYAALINIIRQAQKDAYNEALEEFKIDILGFDNPYSLLSVLDDLVFATEYLLHVKNYDGEKYEELNQSVRRAKEIKESIILKLKKQ